MTTPRVSVCLLVFNHAHRLDAALSGILAQTLADFELIVSDDCSNDGSWELIRSLEDRDVRVRAVRTPRNLGMAGNANFACALAAAPYIALLHHDDIVDPRLLEKWVDVADRYPRAAFVFNDYRSYSKTASHVLEKRGFHEVMEGPGFLARYLLSGWGSPIRGTALIRKECLQAVGGFDERYGLLSDIDLWMRLCARWDVGYVAEPLIQVVHERPADYPREYREFTWERMRILFQIHAAQWQQSARRGASGMLSWLWFRARVSAEVMKWLAYAVAKRKAWMLREAESGRTPYEFAVVDVCRHAMTRLWGRD